MEARRDWVQPRGRTEPPRMRVFCLPHAGGDTNSFRSWQQHFAPHIQVCPIALPGRDSRLSEPLITDFEELVEAIYQGTEGWFDLPFAFFGHSMGSLLAFEWARKLQNRRNLHPRCIFLSGRRAPHLPGGQVAIHDLPDIQFMDELRRCYQGIPEEFSESPELVQFYLPILRADVAVVESYQFQDAEPLNCPMKVFAGANDATVTYDDLLAWNRQTSDAFSAHILPGGHFFVQKPMVMCIAATLYEDRN